MKQTVSVARRVENGDFIEAASDGHCSILCVRFLPQSLGPCVLLNAGHEMTGILNVHKEHHLCSIISCEVKCLEVQDLAVVGLHAAC